MPVPFRLGTGYCGAYEPTGASGSPAQCRRPVSFAGLVLRDASPADGRPVEAWLAFACDRAEHFERLAGRRRLTFEDTREKLRRQREEDRRDYGPGRGFVPARPVATGRSALVLVERARSWGRRHPPD